VIEAVGPCVERLAAGRGVFVLEAHRQRPVHREQCDRPGHDSDSEGAVLQREQHLQVLGRVDGRGGNRGGNLRADRARIEHTGSEEQSGRESGGPHGCPFASGKTPTMTISYGMDHVSCTGSLAEARTLRRTSAKLMRGMPNTCSRAPRWSDRTARSGGVPFTKTMRI